MAAKTLVRQDIMSITDSLNRHGNFIVLEHMKPDGDCIGSGLALVMALRDMGKRALLVSHDPHPQIYDFLPGREFYTRPGYLKPEDFSPDVAVFLDCTGPDRVGDALEFAGSGLWINIDHHVSNSHFAELNLVDPQASATGELVFGLIKALGTPVTPDIALCIYVAILTDTGGFRYANTTARAFRIAASLVDKGVNPADVADRVFETRSMPSLVLCGHALTSLKLHQGGRLATMTVTQEAMRSAGASQEDTEGLISYPRSIAGVEVALLFTETRDNRVRVSFRSRSRMDVAKAALSFGGGGHAAAAGAIVDGTLEEVYQKVLKAIESQMRWMDS